MWAALLLMAATPLSEPPDQLAGELRAAIWDDLMLNAMIGNGNWLGSLWYNASTGDEAKPDLHIADLRCGSGGSRLNCSFSLFRDGGVKVVLNQAAPDELVCNAIVVRTDDDGWGIKHLPPPKGRGHTRTTMKCRVAS